MDATEQRTFGEQIKEYRLRAGLTQEELAERAQLSPRGLVYLERDERRPQPSTARRLADALELKPEQRADFLAAATQPRTGDDRPAEVGAKERRPARLPRPGWRVALVVSVCVLAAAIALLAFASRAHGSHHAQPKTYSTARAPELLGAWGTTAAELSAFVPPIDELSIGPNGDAYAVSYGGNFISALRFSSYGQALGAWHVGPTSAGVGAVHVDARGNLWVSTTRALFKFSPDGHLLGQWGSGFGPGRFDSPVAVAFAHNGDVVVGEYNSHRVQVLTPSMHQIVQWGGPGANPQQFTPNVLALDAQDDVYVMDLGYAQIEKYTLQGKLLAIWHPRGLGSTPNLKEFDLTVGRDGSIYVMFSSAISLAIEKLAPSGREIARWGALGPHGEVSNNLASLQFGDGADGFAATVDGRLLKVDQSLHVLDAWSLQQLRTPLFRAPSAIAADGNGHAYVADPAARQMVELSTASDSVTRWSASIASRSPNPLVAAMAVDPHGNLVVLDASGTKFNAYSSVGRLVRSSRYGGASTGTSAPYTAMGVDGTGNVSALADAGSVVRTFTPSGQLVHSWCANCDVSAPFNLAAAMTESAAGNVYVSYQFEVVEYSPTGLPIHSWTAKGMPATGLAVDPHGNLYVTGLGRNALEILSPSGRVLATWTRLGPHGPAFTDPGAVTVDRQGNIYLVDGQRVLELAPLKPGR